MSVRLENGSVLSADYEDSDERVQNLPVSAQCWLYVPQGVVPGASAFWPVWTLGEPGAQNFLALEATRDQSDPTKVRPTILETGQEPRKTRGFRRGPRRTDLEKAFADAARSCAPVRWGRTGHP